MNDVSAISTTAQIPTSTNHQASDANTFALTAAGRISRHDPRDAGRRSR